MISGRGYNFKFVQTVPLWYLPRVYSAITIFTISYTVTCIDLPLSTSPRREQEYVPHTHRNLNLTVFNSKMTNVEDEDYPERSMIKNDDDNYFDPDTILFSPSDRKTDEFKLDTNNNTYISFNEASSIVGPKYPIKPLKYNTVVLPEPNFRPKLVQHVLQKKLWPVDLVSRKIFIRGNE